MYDIIRNYIPVNKQEIRDWAIMLQLAREPRINREDPGHFTVSGIVLNHQRDQFLFVYHNIYDSWSWMGGHLDGNPDPKEVILKEIREESGLQKVEFISDDIISLEILTVAGHIKKGRYVSGHLHYNITYLLEADSDEPLKIKPDENSGVKWFPLEMMTSVSNEKWFNEHIYNKLYDFIKNNLKDG